MELVFCLFFMVFFFQAEDGIRDGHVTGVQTCALPIWPVNSRVPSRSQRNRETTKARITGRIRKAVTPIRLGAISSHPTRGRRGFIGPPRVKHSLGRSLAQR